MQKFATKSLKTGTNAPKANGGKWRKMEENGGNSGAVNDGYNLCKSATILRVDNLCNNNHQYNNNNCRCHRNRHYHRHNNKENDKSLNGKTEVSLILWLSVVVVVRKC